jgi:outer membrane protein OmpA-like peptidoglycan-associated protein
MKKLAIWNLVFLMAIAPGLLNAQINLKDKLKNAGNNRANERTDQGIEKGMDAVENGVKNLFKKKKKADDGEPAEGDAQEGQKPEGLEQKPAVSANLSLQSYSKFDFIPGEKVIFFEDYTQDAIGDFPALWNTNGSGEVQTTNLYPGRWLAMRANSDLMPETKLTMTGNYTIEFDMILGTDAQNSMNEHLIISLLKTDGKWKIGDFQTDCMSLNFNTHDVSGFSRKASQDFFNVPPKEMNIFDKEHDYNKPVHVSLWIQNQRLRCYLNESKVLDLPRVIPPTTTYNALQFRFEYDGPGTSMISNVRIAQGLPDTRNKLLTEGKLVTYGIYFDVNKADVKPESYGTLKEIAGILNEVPDVKVKIVGHTDSDGDDAKNMDLSKRRAASVKAELAKTFGVNADRLVTDGMGETQPVAPNDTPANKALNRRVEFIKL